MKLHYYIDTNIMSYDIYYYWLSGYYWLNFFLYGEVIYTVLSIEKSNKDAIKSIKISEIVLAEKPSDTESIFDVISKKLQEILKEIEEKTQGKNLLN